MPLLFYTNTWQSYLVDLLCRDLFWIGKSCKSNEFIQCEPAMTRVWTKSFSILNQALHLLCRSGMMNGMFTDHRVIIELQWNLDNSNCRGPPKNVGVMNSSSYESCSLFALAMCPSSRAHFTLVYSISWLNFLKFARFSSHVKRKQWN